MKKCIFCLRDSQNSISVEHIIPESLGGSIILQKGNVCDNCNKYFSTNVDKAIQEYHFLGILKTILVNRTKKKKGPKLDLQSISFERDNESDILKMKLRSCKIIHDTQNHIIRLQFRRPDIDMQLVSRAIHKMAFEFRCKYRGWQQAISKRFNAIRSYVRNPRVNEYWEFGQKPHPMFNKKPFDFCDITKYGCLCSMIRIYDIEFIVDNFGHLPNENIVVDGYEIITKDQSSKIEYEEMLLPYDPLY
jgi:hypothetical protein